MKLRTRLNLVVGTLTATFVAVLLTAELQNTRAAVREEIQAANLVASHLLGTLAASYSSDGGLDRVLQFLGETGRVRANEVVVQSAQGTELYKSPPSTYKAGREAPAWFSHLLAPKVAPQTFPLPGGVLLTVQADASRAVLDAWDSATQLAGVALTMLVVVNGLAFWTVGRALAPFPVIADGLERIQRGDLDYRLPPLHGFEARAMGTAFNRMAQAVENSVQAERKARDAEMQLEERREMSRVVEQRIEEERRLIAHELHDEFGQSVTAIRSLAIAIATRSEAHDAETSETARLISDEAARLYDAMHGLIPRLAPLSLDTLGLSETVENHVRDWQRRYPSISIAVQNDLTTDLGPSVTLALYRVVQEGLLNAIRHAQASRVQIELQSDEKRVVVSITDDGIGLPSDCLGPGHFGLRGLAERVANLGGEFHIGSGDPVGVSLTAEIPLEANA